MAAVPGGLGGGEAAPSRGRSPHLSPFTVHRSPFTRRRRACAILGAMKRGQTTVEYLLVMVLLMSAALLAGWLVRAVNTQHARTQLLLGSDYP